MNSRDRVIKTLEFQYPDRIPIELWLHGATRLKYGKSLTAILEKYPQDILRIEGPMDSAFYPEEFMVGEYKDLWGSTWMVLQEGMVGEVKNPALNDISEVCEYEMPFETLKKHWDERGGEVDRKIDEGKMNNQFIIGGHLNLFERMQFIRGTENLYLDLALEKENVMIFLNKLVEYYKEYLKYWLKRNIDAIVFFDDWGSQKSLLISPEMWREIFKPSYKELIGIIKEHGKYVFFHSCGYILELYDELIDLGVDAINSQVWCMGIEKVAQKCAGRITLWGELDRQKTLAFGSPQDIFRDAMNMKEKFFVNGGGLIGESLAGKDVPLENIEAMLTCWNK